MALAQKAVPTVLPAADGLARRKRRAERLVAARGRKAKSDTRADHVELDAEMGDEEAPKKASADRAKKSKTDGSGYLSLYFRDMQALHVLRPEEEFTAAR